MFINFAASTKLHRVTQINTDLGASATATVLTGPPPPSVETTATGTPLVSLPCDGTAFGTVFLGADDPVITTNGTGYANGTYALSFTGGTGTGAAGTYVCSGGTIDSVGITNPGSYTVAPSVAFVNGGGSGATAVVPLTGVLLANAITTTNAVANGVAGYMRLATSGGVGIVDLDVGTSNTSAIINTTTIVTGGPVSCTSLLIVEV